MILGVYAVFDVKADAYISPFFQSNDGMARRVFSDGANDKETMLGRHPEDYKLVRVGKFDDRTGVITEDVHESLGFASDYVRKE